jgi:hypothetical protein
MASRRVFQNGLRALLVAGSMTGFVSGWAFLAHAGKPASSTTAATLPAPAVLAPLDLSSLAPNGAIQSNNRGSLQASPQNSLPFSNTPNVQPLPSTPRQSFNAPRLRSRGS